VHIARNPRLGFAWMALCAALALHVTDEALTGFLAVYNATVLAARSRSAWLPFPTFEFRNWLTGLIFTVVVLFALSPFFFSNARWIRPLGYFAAFINVLNALGHTTATIFGRTVTSVSFQRPAPGFWSSPVLFAAAVWLMVELRSSRWRVGRSPTAD
jgi:cation transport ATPase